MTPENFRQHEEFLLNCIRDAKTAEDAKFASNLLQDLYSLLVSPLLTDPAEKPKRKPRKKMTAVEKFDKKNSRRDAIMAQRERHGTRSV